MADTTLESEIGGLLGFQFDNSYSRLPDVFYAPAVPARVRLPRVVILNHALARELGLEFDRLSAEQAAALFAGQVIPLGAEPIAQAYAGHQFGGFTVLGDGRAILLGEHRTPSGRRVDVQFKGSGPTRYSRRGDGLAALAPMLREYLISEAMAALGIPTTRSLAVVTTGEIVFRDRPLPGAILTRVAASHLRVGTFEYAARLRDESHLRTLADYAIQRHDPHLQDDPQKYLKFFRAVMERQAALVAQWMLIGFIHGVMNTDNMTISGETIDYGPCAFMNTYRPETVFSSIDHMGRYAYRNQPAIAQWNLARFAESLLTLFDADAEKAISQATEVLNAFPNQFAQQWMTGLRHKLGLLISHPDDAELFRKLFTWMEATQADFTNTFRDLSWLDLTTCENCDTLYLSQDFQDWLRAWQSRLQSEGRSILDAQRLMRTVNPVVIPRNHRVEEALSAAEAGDFAPFERMLDVIRHPYELHPEWAIYQEPPVDETNYRTFCGT